MGQASNPNLGHCGVGIDTLEDADAALHANQAVVTGRWRRGGKQHATPQGLDNGRDEEATEVIRRQIRSPVQRGMLGILQAYRRLRQRVAQQDSYQQLLGTGGQTAELPALYRKLGGDVEPD